MADLNIFINNKNKENQSRVGTTCKQLFLLNYTFLLTYWAV